MDVGLLCTFTFTESKRLLSHSFSAFLLTHVNVIKVSVMVWYTTIPGLCFFLVLFFVRLYRCVSSCVFLL